MTGGVQIEPVAVARHASLLDELAERLALARSAVREVTMDHQAYGELCQFLPGVLSPLFGAAVQILNETTDALSETAIKVRAAAEVIEATDLGGAGQIAEAPSL